MQKEKYLFMECVHFWRQCNGCYLSSDSLPMFMPQSNAVYIIFCALFKNLRWCMVKRLHSCHHEMLLLCSFYSFFYHLFSICKHKIDFMIDNMTLRMKLQWKITKMIKLVKKRFSERYNFLDCNNF